MYTEWAFHQALHSACKVQTESRGGDKCPVWLSLHWSGTRGFVTRTPQLTSFHMQHYLITIGCHGCTMKVMNYKHNRAIKRHCGTVPERREGCWRQRGIKETVKECVEAERRTEEEERNVREKHKGEKNWNQELRTRKCTQREGKKERLLYNFMCP